MDTTETTTSAFSAHSSLNPDSNFGYIRSFLTGRTGRDFLQECYSLQEAYEEITEEFSSQGSLGSLESFGLELAELARTRKLLAKLIGLATAQGFQFGTASRVIAHGYPGVIVETHEHDEYLAGMVTVRLESGEIIIPRSELIAP